MRRQLSAFVVAAVFAGGVALTAAPTAHAAPAADQVSVTSSCKTYRDQANRLYKRANDLRRVGQHAQANKVAKAAKVAGNMYMACKKADEDMQGHF